MPIASLLFLQAFDSRLFGLGGSQSNRFVPLLSADVSATTNGKKRSSRQASSRQNGLPPGHPPRPPTAPPQPQDPQVNHSGHNLPPLQQPYAIPEAVPKGRHGPIGPQRSRTGADGRARHTSANGATAAGSGPVSQEGPQTQMGPESSFTQSFDGFSQDAYRIPRDYDFKSQDSLQSDSLYMTQQFPAHQTQVKISSVEQMQVDCTNGGLYAHLLWTTGEHCSRFLLLFNVPS